MTAIVAGSFDPVTNGHIDLIRRAEKIFGDVHVLVAVNPDKQYMFSSSLRAEAIRVCFGGGHITVKVFDGMISDYASSLDGGSVVVRGIRDEKDLRYELKLCRIYREMGIMDTVLLPSDGELSSVSSTDAREDIKKYGKSEYIPKKAMEVLKKEL